MGDLGSLGKVLTGTELGIEFMGRNKGLIQGSLLMTQSRMEAGLQRMTAQSSPFVLQTRRARLSL